MLYGHSLKTANTKFPPTFVKGFQFLIVTISLIQGRLTTFNKKQIFLESARKNQHYNVILNIEL